MTSQRRRSRPSPRRHRPSLSARRAGENRRPTLSVLTSDPVPRPAVSPPERDWNPQNLERPPAESFWADTLTKAAIIVGAIALLVGAGAGLRFAKIEALSNLGGLSWMGGVAIAAAIVVGVATLYRTVLWFAYKPLDGSPLRDAELPSLTVVIPSYNEGEMVAKTIASALAARYPVEKLHIVAVDDGSKDDTYLHIQKAAALAPGRVTALRLPENRGKRHALHRGFCEANSQLVVTLDSDSVMPTESLRHIVAPFVADAKTGAVAGCIKVFNRYDNVLTRMLGVRYLLGFSFTRAYQSVIRSVLCCPGAFAAYRLDVIRPHLNAWLNQTFLGNPCTNGDDHSMTNYVLRSNYDVLYQENADVYTVVPNTYKRLTKMLTRWARSNIRESLIWTRFSWGRTRNRGLWLAWLDGWIHLIQIPARIGLAALPVVLLTANLSLLVATLSAATLFSILYAGYFLRAEKSTESIWGIAYAWYAVFTLFWIYPVAALTVRQNRWMTRG